MWKYTRLIGLPHYRQGPDDGLCLFYSASMLLASLWPKYRMRISTAFKSGSLFHLKSGHPIIRALHRKFRGDELHAAIGRWVSGGYAMSDAADLLNDVVGEDFFRYEKVRLRAARGAIRKAVLPRALQELLDQGLPFIVAGSHGESALTGHAGLAVGYAWEAGDGRKVGDCEILFQDPSSANAFESAVIREFATSESSFGHIIRPTRWPGAAPRPDRLCVEGEDDCFVERWSGDRYLRWQVSEERRACATGR